MSRTPNGAQAAAAMEELFGGDVRTTSDRILLNICKVSGFFAVSSQLFDPFINRLHGIAQKSVIALLIILIVTFIATLCLVGIRSVGRSASKRSFFTQTWYVLARVTLYILLPCALITFLLILWGVSTHQAAFR